MTAGTPTVVTFTSTITDPALLANGVNLIRTTLRAKHPPSSASCTTMGSTAMRVAGNKTFGLRVHVSESTAGATYYRVSAAFRGVLLRTLSPVVALQITQAAARPSVAAQDDARTSSASIGEFGGSVSTTAADGTIYSLDSACGSPERVDDDHDHAGDGAFQPAVLRPEPLRGSAGTERPAAGAAGGVDHAARCRVEPGLVQRADLRR